MNSPQATERVRADRPGDVVLAAYDAALDSSAESRRPGSRQPVIEEAWQRIFPKAATLVAAGPAQVIAAVTNALYQLASTPGASRAVD